MAIYIALLRGINVGGHKQVGMADLRELVTDQGFEAVQSLALSGNLVFQAEAQSGAQLERLLEAETAKRLALQADFLVRTAQEWKALMARNPFPEEAKRDPGHLLVMSLKDAPAARNVKELQAAITGREVVRAQGRQAYLVYPDGVGRSLLTHTLIERKLGTRGTARNWNTVVKLGALISGG
jgi:uncharacterized protein (DUF1697 family)